MGDVTLRDLLNRIDDDRTVVHRVTTADLDARAHPDTDRAPDTAAPDAVTQLLREYHREPASLYTPEVQMRTDEFTKTMTRVFSELIDGPNPKGGVVLNTGDIGLLRSLDKISAADASRSTNDGATI